MVSPHILFVDPRETSVLVNYLSWFSLVVLCDWALTVVLPPVLALLAPLSPQSQLSALGSYCSWPSVGSAEPYNPGLVKHAQDALSVQREAHSHVTQWSLHNMGFALKVVYWMSDA